MLAGFVAVLALLASPAKAQTSLQPVTIKVCSPTKPRAYEWMD